MRTVPLPGSVVRELCVIGDSPAGLLMFWMDTLITAIAVARPAAHDCQVPGRIAGERYSEQNDD